MVRTERNISNIDLCVNDIILLNYLIVLLCNLGTTAKEPVNVNGNV